MTGDERGVAFAPAAVRGQPGGNVLGERIHAGRVARGLSRVGRCQLASVGDIGGRRYVFAAKNPGDIAFIVLLAGPGVPGDEILVEQSSLILKAMGKDSAATS